MNPPLPDRSQLEAGAARLARPLLPLVRLLQLLYLTAPVTRIEQVLALLDEPLRRPGSPTGSRAGSWPPTWRFYRLWKR